MAATVSEQTRIRQFGDGNENFVVAEKNEVVAVEVEPGVFAYKAVQTKAIIKTQEDVPRIQTRNLQPALPAPSSDYVAVKRDRGCCAECFHCDEDEWYKCTGKGPGWIPIYILFYLILGTVGLAILIICCVCVCFFGSNNNDNR